MNSYTVNIQFNPSLTRESVPEITHSKHWNYSEFERGEKKKRHQSEERSPHNSLQFLRRKLPLIFYNNDKKKNRGLSITFIQHNVLVLSEYPQPHAAELHNLGLIAESPPLYSS